MQFFGLSEPQIRLSAFAIIFASMALLELLHPRLERPELHAALKRHRWFTNIGMLILSSALLRLIFPMAAVGTALYADTHKIGLFHLWDGDNWLKGVLSFILLDFSVWAEHVASHKIPLIWRIHRVHHADPGIDVTTALRFHPAEIVLSMVFKAALILILGAPPEAVLVFEVVLNGAAMFNHANIAIPEKLDRALRLLIVTPDMHRIHHSTNPDETDSNYGFNLSIWDRLFSVYTQDPRLGKTDVEIGLSDFGRTNPVQFGWSLLLPFRKK